MTKAKGAPKKTVLFGIGAAIILLLLTLVIYQVDSTEYAVVTQFGQPVRVVEDAGLKIKLPDPIQSVQRLDKRVQVYQTSSIELLTLDRLNVSLDYYGTWKIVDPILFLQTVRDNIGAEARLLDVFSSSLSVQLGQYKLEQLVNTDAEKLELDTMIADTVAYAKERAAEYGIEVVDAQIRVLNFPEANKQSVYDRMSAERKPLTSVRTQKRSSSSFWRKPIRRFRRSWAKAMPRPSAFTAKRSRRTRNFMSSSALWKPTKRPLMATRR